MLLVASLIVYITQHFLVKPIQTRQMDLIWSKNNNFIIICEKKNGLRQLHKTKKQFVCHILIITSSNQTAFNSISKSVNVNLWTFCHQVQLDIIHHTLFSIIIRTLKRLSHLVLLWQEGDLMKENWWNVTENKCLLTCLWEIQSSMKEWMSF